MAVLGILARIESSRFELVWQELLEKEGTTPFPIENETGRIGILIEKSPVSEAYQILDSLHNSPDLLGLWPVYEHLEDEAIPLNENRDSNQEPSPLLINSEEISS